MLTPLLVWVVLSVAVGFLGRDRTPGFWGFLVFSLVFSPLVGVLGLLIAGSRPSTPRRQARAPGADAAARQVECLRTKVCKLERLAREQASALEELRSTVHKSATVTGCPALAVVTPKAPLGATLDVRLDSRPD